MDKSIEHLIEKFNNGWTQGDFESLASLLHENVVFIAPDLITEIIGKEACLQTIKEYVDNADTRHFVVEEQRVHVWQQTANISIKYSIEYLMEGKNYKESGKEFWTMIQEQNQWKLVWRAMVANESLE